MSNFDERMGAQVRRLRTLLGMSQEELGRRMGAQDRPLLQATVARMESGKRHFLACEVVALSEVFSCSPGDWYSETAEEIAMSSSAVLQERRDAEEQRRKDEEARAAAKERVAQARRELDEARRALVEVS